MPRMRKPAFWMHGEDLAGLAGGYGVGFDDCEKVRST